MKLTHLLTLSGVALALAFAPVAFAQDGGGRGQRGQGGGPGGGNWDPAQMQQRMMERIKEQLEITNDSEWRAIEPLIVKVTEARRETAGMGMAAMMRGGRGGGPGGQGGRGGGMFGEPNPAADALQRAIDSKGSASELKTAMAKYRDARKAAEEKLQKAQDDLRKVLTTRQEAILLANGTLN